jgi:hypothetical protein
MMRGSDILPTLMSPDYFDAVAGMQRCLRPSRAREYRSVKCHGYSRPNRIYVHAAQQGAYGPDRERRVTAVETNLFQRI